MKAKETAVIMIEFQNEFCKPGGKLYEVCKSELERQKIIPNAIRLLEGARRKGCLIIHSPFVFDEQWVSDMCSRGILANAKAGGAFRPGDWGTEIIEELKPAKDEIVLSGKRALSGFSHTGLDGLLKKHQIRNVVCAGFLTNVCVESTARSAYDRGYQVTIIRDATGATSKENQEFAEREMFPVLGGSMTVGEFIENLE